MNDDDFSFGKKKKKRNKRSVEEDVDNATTCTSSSTLVTDTANEVSGDYTYKYLLDRLYANLVFVGEEDDNNKKFSLKNPQVFKVGAKKTAFANFLDILVQLRRPVSHFQNFVCIELGTVGSFDAQKKLVLKGVFDCKQVSKVVIKYAKEYVICSSCGGNRTFLTKEERLFFVECESCRGKTSVPAISRGFTAQTKKRSSRRM